MKWIAVLFPLALGIFAACISVWVEQEADYRSENLGGNGTHRALVLFHPSREAGFSDDLSLAFAEGLKSVGFLVERATVTSLTPEHPEGYALIGVVSNTYWWTMDLPTHRYLAQARWQGIPAVGLIGGAGSTDRSERVLGEALRATGATVLGTRSFWLWRPNDKSRMNEINRGVARDMARQFGVESGKKVREMLHSAARQ